MTSQSNAPLHQSCTLCRRSDNLLVNFKDMFKLPLAKQGRIKQSKAKQSRAMQDKTEQGKARQHYSNHKHYVEDQYYNLLANFKNKLKLPFAKQDLTKQPNALFYRKGQYMYAMSLFMLMALCDLYI